MEETNPSPLTSFPNEHPTQSLQIPLPFYRSRIFFFSCIALVLIATGLAVGTVLLGKNETKHPDQARLDHPPIPTAITAEWKTYPNTSYAYEIKYDKDTTPKEMNTAQYGYTEFSNGCMKVYAVPQTIAATLPEEKNGIPWKQLNDLKTMPIGQSRNCSIIMFTFGEDGKAIVDRNDYTRENETTIAGQEWYTFTVKNGASADVSKDTVYFTEKNNNTYVIETKTGGICPTTPKNMLSTFSFTK